MRAAIIETARRLILIGIAENERDFELRKSAIANLGRVNGEKSLAVLISTLDSSPEFELQKQAVSAIGRRPKDEAVPILIRTARSNPRVELRKLAIQILGRIGDERAVAFFNELLASNQRATSARTNTGENMSALTWRTEDPSTSRQAVNFLRDEAFESRLTSLRDVAMELLNVVDCLREHHT